MKVGIIGLETSGKKSLFSLLTGKKVLSYNTAQEEIGTVHVPDERIDRLAEFYKAPKKVYSRIEFHLVPSLKKESQETAKALIEAKEVDMFALVIRQFTDQSVPHPYDTVDMARDYALIKHELIFADLFLLETRLERIEKQLKSKKEDLLVREKELIGKLKTALEKETLLNRLDLKEDEVKMVKSFSLLTLKPVFVIVNCDEDKLKEEFVLPDGMKCLTVSIKIESEIQELEEAEKKDFLSQIGLEETSLNRLIRFSYSFADLISFITAGEKESHSWTIKNGTTALKAAGVIHTDFEKGFIRAEVIPYEALMKAGSEAEAKKAGLYRLEGKDYVVKDGDIIVFRFNL